ncbi:DNA-binding transcriptional regulator LsrR (DeoR family) [Oceanobacillus polygoni]|uniref:DNA-binding transcriptional regulator LsrR (DeoR family) n=1 Tax=Oceanobacillus polygoni TaxID=1235259 RepID=A0A9X0YVG7_9BACI|nr:DNA-binding transcriptional regulator LsrR (DeoR family) [Oceanobacillus polygoni]
MDQKYAQITRVAELYYQRNLTAKAIRNYGVSRLTVSRLLEESMRQDL